IRDKDQVGPQGHELPCSGTQALRIIARLEFIEHEITAVDPAETGKPALESIETIRCGRCDDVEPSDPPHAPALLRARRERQHGSTGESGYEFSSRNGDCHLPARQVSSRRANHTILWGRLYRRHTRR